MRKIGFVLLLTTFLTFIFYHPLPAKAEGILQEGFLDIDGDQTKQIYIIQKNNKVYIPLCTIANCLGINTEWDGKTNTITLTYPNQRQVKINLKSKKFYKEALWNSLGVIVYEGTTYVLKDDLESLIERKTGWDDQTNTFYVYMYVHPQQGYSVLKVLPYEGFQIKRNTIFFNVETLPQASWKLNGELRDFRLINHTKQSNIEEVQYAAFYKTDEGLNNQLLITQRKLPNGDQIIFIKGYAPKEDQVLEYKATPSDRIYGSAAYHYIDHGPLHTLLAEEPYRHHQRLTIKAGESLDQWYLFSRESLAVQDIYIKRAWEVSENYHKTNTWVTAEGTHRRTPVAYQDKKKYYNKNINNINLQASVPMLLLETLQVKHHRLLEDVVHNAKFTLVKWLGRNRFWHAGLDAAYLNRAYGLGRNYIDTRMSVDASLFLIRYGLMFDDQEAIEKGKQFKQYFLMLKEKGLTYQLNGGYLYPDYFSERQKKKTLVSLNHALYEMNYLYTLYHWLGDAEAKQLADEMLRFIHHSANRWITANGDFYYALSPEGKYYGKDYVNITYMDLFVTQSILHYAGLEDPVIQQLFKQKGKYLDQIKSPLYESHLHMDKIFQTFDQKISTKGGLFFSYPLQVKMAAEYDSAYFAYGAYHWIKGAERITFKQQTIPLDPKKKYMVILTKEKLYLLDKPIQEINVKAGELIFKAKDSSIE